MFGDSFVCLFVACIHQIVCCMQLANRFIINGTIIRTVHGWRIHIRATNHTRRGFGPHTIQTIVPFSSTGIRQSFATIISRKFIRCPKLLRYVAHTHCKGYAKWLLFGFYTISVFVFLFDQRGMHMSSTTVHFTITVVIMADSLSDTISYYKGKQVSSIHAHTNAHFEFSIFAS